MPRPKKLKNAVIVPIVLEHELKNKAILRAKNMNMSLSEYIRSLILNDLGMKPAQIEAPAPGPDPETDPIQELEIRDLEASLDDLSNRIQIWLERQRQYMSTLRYGSYSGSQPLSWDMVKRWTREWHGLKRWYYSVRDRSPGDQALGTVQSKLITVHDMIEEARKLLMSKT